MKCRLGVLQIIIFAMMGFFLGCGNNEENKSLESTTIGNNNDYQKIPVEAFIVREKNVHRNFSSGGVLQPKHDVDIVAEVAGKIEKIYKSIGDRVTRNDVLALIDDDIPLSNYKQARSQVLSAESNLKIVRLNLISDEELFKSGDISKLEYENSSLTVKTAEANHLSAIATLSLLEKAYNDTRVKSPFNGQISRKYIDIGKMVNPNMPLYRVVDLSSLKLELGIPQEFISDVHPGTRVRVVVSALNDENFEGQVLYISPQADERTGSFTVEIHVKNTSQGRLKAGMTAKAEIIFESNSNQLLIPDHAIVKSNDSSFVFLISGNHASPVPVITGDIYKNLVTVKKGLAEGDTIVVVGLKNLTDKSPVWIESVQ